MTRKLTPKQEAFRIAYLEKHNGREAYKIAYTAEGMSDNAIDVEVNKLLKHPVLGPMITQGLERQTQRMQVHADVRGLLTMEEHDKNLKELCQEARVDGKFAAAIQAEVKRGELRRFYVKQVEVGEAGEFDRMSDDELDTYLAEEAEELGIAVRH